MTVRPWSGPGTPAWWTLLLLNVVGGGASLLLMTLLGWPVPRSTAMAVGALLVAATLFLVVLGRWVDPVERRPSWLVAAAVVYGGSGAIAVGLGSGPIAALMAKTVSLEFANAWGVAVMAPVAEEAGKLGGVALLMLAARPYLATVWSGAVYGALVGLGFTLVEDFGYAASAADEVYQDDVRAAAELLLMRVLTGFALGHPLYTALAGAGLAYAVLRVERSIGSRALALIAGIGAAVLLHALNNSPIVGWAAKTVDPLPGVSGWTGYLALIYLAALPGLIVLWMLRRQAVLHGLRRPATLGLPGITDGDVTVLSRWASCRRESSALRRSHGKQATAAFRLLRRARLRLCGEVAQPYRGWPAVLSPAQYAPTVHKALEEVRQARAALEQACQPQHAEPANAAVASSRLTSKAVAVPRHPEHDESPHPDRGGSSHPERSDTHEPRAAPVGRPTASRLVALVAATVGYSWLLGGLLSLTEGS
ncbi:PrsW family intramembrane metalloprotease [Pilimelia columellifera]|uniref:Uncharacterized protein n=1 Tax=Pilimelia columellifera subsp. columellifera TaxID=706583 RepID=A0ABP6AM19_9ACTN